MQLVKAIIKSNKNAPKQLSAPGHGNKILGYEVLELFSYTHTFHFVSLSPNKWK
jgi:hypothetical protein